MRERYERMVQKHHKTREEEKRIQNEARARKAGQRPKKRQRGYEDFDEDEELGFEKIRREAASRASTGGASIIPPSPLEIPDTALVGRVVEVHRTRLRARFEGGDEVDVAPSRRFPPLVVGDRVWIDGVNLEPLIVGVEERRTSLVRPGADEAADGRLIFESMVTALSHA